MKTRAIAYTRVSSQRQVDEGNSLEVQEKHILEHAEKNNIEIMRFFVEEGESAKKHKSPPTTSYASIYVRE